MAKQESTNPAFDLMCHDLNTTQVSMICEFHNIHTLHLASGASLMCIPWSWCE